MKISKWAGVLEFTGAEGSAPVNQSFKFSGGSCLRDELPEMVSKAIGDAMKLLGNRGESVMQAEIEALKAALAKAEAARESAEKKARLLVEANEIEATVPTASDDPPPAPVPAPVKRSNRR